MMEEWRQIPSFPNYEASSLGRIRRIGGQAWSKTEVLKTRIERGYERIGLFLNGRQRRRGVHVHVCEAFHGLKPTAAHHAAHVDGDSSRNHASNLCWKTPSENEQDKVLHGTALRGEKNKRTVLSAESAKAIRDACRAHMRGRVRAKRGFLKDLADQHGVARSTVGKISTGKNWRHL